MKDKTYWHSEVDVQDIPFDKVYVDNHIDYTDIVNHYNNATTYEEKLKWSTQLPDELFCTCRICGKRILNSNFRIGYVKKSSICKNDVPKIRYRVVDGVQHELSCCEDCLKTQFKDTPPKAPKYYFMKANKYGAYCFNLSEDEYRKICSSVTGVTEKSMIKKWGKEEGQKRWAEYCQKQADTNSFEYKHEKYGWSKSDFKKFNKNRAVTKELCIARHGKEEGLKIWAHYCERQRYTTSLEYMIEQYGEEEGRKKFENFCIERINNTVSYSKQSISLFNYVLKLLDLYHIPTTNIYYSTHNKEYPVISDKKSYMLDYYDKDNNILIEYYGNYWHASPKLFKENDIIRVRKYSLLNKKSEEAEVTAKDIWEKDDARMKDIDKILNHPSCLIVWESDWKHDQIGTLKNIMKELYHIDVEIDENFLIENETIFEEN